MDTTEDSRVDVVLIEESDEYADFLSRILTVATGGGANVVRIRDASPQALGICGPASLVLLCAGARQALQRFFEVRMRMPDCPIVVVCNDDDELALRILKAGAEDCLFRHEVRDGALLWRALQYALERHRLRVALECGSARLAAREETFRRMIEQQADAVVIVDEQRAVRFANPAAERLYGEPAARLLGRAFQHPLTPGHITSARTDDDRLLEIRAVDIEWASAPAVLVSMRDISESVRRELDVLRAGQFEMLGVLAGGIAHDMNNFLTSLCLNVHFALRVGGDNLALREILTDMQKAIPRASELTQQLLTFAKGGTPVRGETLLSELIRETASFSLRGSNVDCEYLLDDDLWPVTLDGGPISQILNNLVVNANQAMPDGGTLRIHAENLSIDAESGNLGSPGRLSPGAYVHLRVQDQGPGIPPEHLDRIFEPYFTTKCDGNGLGLANCRSILQALGGHVHVESSPRGTCFHVYLPAVTSASAVGHRPERPRLLFMDDQEAICRVVARIFEDLGLDVDFARDGYEAVEKFERARAAGRSYAAVVLDVTVPGGMGAERTIQRLLALDPHVRAVVSSAYPRDPLMRHPSLYGFAGSIAKPYDMDDLTIALQQIGVPVARFSPSTR